MKCDKCNWEGSQHELVCENVTNFVKLLEINSWKYCPQCKNEFKLDFFKSSLSLTTNYSRSTLQIANNNRFYRKPMIVSLERILDFNVSPHNRQLFNMNEPLLIHGYKRYDKVQYNLIIPTSFANESQILIKIIHILHMQKYHCESKQINGLMCFGQFGVIDQDNFDFNKINRKCSFCARFYEWENNQNNGWPLSFKKVQELLSVKSITQKNNKFSKIFSNDIIKTNDKICYCNEITQMPNLSCYYHSNEKSPDSQLLENLRRTTFTTDGDPIPVNQMRW